MVAALELFATGNDVPTGWGGGCEEGSICCEGHGCEGVIGEGGVLVGPIEVALEVEGDGGEKMASGSVDAEGGGAGLDALECVARFPVGGVGVFGVGVVGVGRRDGDHVAEVAGVIVAGNPGDDKGIVAGIRVVFGEGDGVLAFVLRGGEVV